MQGTPAAEFTAKDLMSDQVLCAYEGWSIQRLADFFMQHNINGAPVMASDHQLVGVVSVSDIFKFENASDEVKGSALLNCYRDTCGVEIPLYNDLQQWTHKAHNSCTVHQIMIDHIISVEVSQPQTDVAQLLVDHNIHRVFVTEDQKIVGVISTTDLLRTMVPTEQPALAIRH